MYEALSIAATGLRNQQNRIDTIAGNVANANTVAYKSARLDFKDALYTTGVVPGPPRSPDENQQKGHGLMVAGIGRDWRNGNFERTERMLDFAIEGEGFFALMAPGGDTIYTRGGNFYLSTEATGTYIVNSNGLYVLDQNGGRIRIPAGTTSIETDTSGTIRFVNNSVELGRATLGIFTFRNLTGLASAGEGNYTQTPAAGTRLPAGGAIIRQGILEQSNVNMAEEMTRLIRTQRAFQLASRALSTADDMEGIANNMRR